ncbi:hypothetical protein HY061_00305, partial [Candidatus Azambacteria bacterium]|nr:hypothetical protein [Candidatus Azambacteria bacterium]
FFYSVKTKITEPLTRLTKLNKPAQATFAFKLIDRRIEETVPQLSTFYQDSTKALLQLAVPVMEISQETSDLIDNDDFEDEKNSSNIMESNV